MRRHALTEAQWERLQAVLPVQRHGPTAYRGDRLFIEAVLFRAKTGTPWRDLPERFGPWKSVYNRFDNWSRAGHWKAIFRALQLEVDEVGSIVDGSVVRAHQDASEGQRHEMIAADELLAHARGKALIGDTGYDSTDSEKPFAPKV